jgi:hypothetical protein
VIDMQRSTAAITSASVTFDGDSGPASRSEHNGRLKLGFEDLANEPWRGVAGGSVSEDVLHDKRRRIDAQFAKWFEPGDKQVDTGS